MNFFEISAYILIGIGSGIIGGLVGIGGGVVTVPALLLVFSFLSFPEADIMKIVLGTSLAATAINSLSSTYFHSKHKAVDGSVIKKMLPGILIGALAGSFIAKKIPEHPLQILFGVFSVCVAVRFFKTNKKKSASAPTKPSELGWNLSGGVIASLSNILGVGGGIFTVPLLTFFKFPPKKVIGTSSCLSFVISFCGSLLFLQKTKGSFPLSLGYIYLPAFFLIGVPSFFAASYGAKLAHKLPVPLIRKIFAVCMLGVGCFMLFRVGKG